MALTTYKREASMTKQKQWTVPDTVAVFELVISNKGQWPTGEQFSALMREVGCSRGSAETVVWRAQSVLGYPVTSARGITRMDRELAALYRERDPRMRR